MDMWGCVGWGKYFPEDNGTRKALQLQPAYSHARNSWWVGFVVAPSHCGILSLFASDHFPANKRPWFLPVPYPTCTLLFNPLKIPFIEAALPILKLHVLSGMRSLFPVSKFPIFLLNWGSHSQLYLKEAVEAVVIQFIFIYVRRSKPLMMLLVFLKHPWPSGAESSCISGKQVPLRYSRSSSKWCTPNCQAHALPLHKQTDFTASHHSLFAPSPSFAESFSPSICPSLLMQTRCLHIILLPLSIIFSWQLAYILTLLAWVTWFLSHHFTKKYFSFSSRCSPLGHDWQYISSGFCRRF